MFKGIKWTGLKRFNMDRTEEVQRSKVDRTKEVQNGQD